jgi:hypothetical protein
MKYIFLMTILVCKAIAACAQFHESEFTIYRNGLIYDDTTINRLKLIVDSLHLKYKNCDFKKAYYSLAQARGHHIFLDTTNISQALKDIQNNMSLGDFIKKYPLARVDSNTLITLEEETMDNNKSIVYTDQISFDGEFEQIMLNGDSADKTYACEYFIQGRIGNWVYHYTVGQDYTTEKINIFYIETPFRTITLPDRYASLVIYSDCMIDTTTSTFLATAKTGHLFNETGGPKYQAFVKYLRKKVHYPVEEFLLFM